MFVWMKREKFYVLLKQLNYHDNVGNCYDFNCDCSLVFGSFYSLGNCLANCSPIKGTIEGWKRFVDILKPQKMKLTQFNVHKERLGE